MNTPIRVKNQGGKSTKGCQEIEEIEFSTHL